MSRMREKRNAKSGFTLVEIMVVMFLLSLLLMSAQGVFNLSKSVWMKSRAISLNVSSIVDGEALVRRVLANTRPYPLNDAGDKGFVGGVTSATFVSELPEAYSRLGLIKVRMAYEAEAAELVLWADGRRHVLLSSVRNADFSYYNLATRRWMKQWSVDEAKIPSAIRLELKVGSEPNIDGVEIVQQVWATAVPAFNISF